MSRRVLTWFALQYLFFDGSEMPFRCIIATWVMSVENALSAHYLNIHCTQLRIRPLSTETHWTLGDAWAYPCCANVPWVIMRSRYICFLGSSKHALSHLVLNSPASGSLWHLLSQTLCKGIPVLQGTGTFKILTLQIWDPSKPHRPLMIQSAAWRKEACRCSSWLPETVSKAICTWKTFKTGVAT